MQLSIINFLSEVIQDVQVFVENGRYQWGLVLMISLVTVCPSEDNIFQNKKNPKYFVTLSKVS